MLLLGSRALTVAPLIVVPILVAFDAGSVALLHLAASDNAAEAGRAGVSAIAFENQATPHTAQSAFDAATSVAESHGERVDPKTFRVHSNGSVTLTVAKSTSTVVFEHLPILRGLTSTQNTMTVSRSNW